MMKLGGRQDTWTYGHRADSPPSKPWCAICRFAFLFLALSLCGIGAHAGILTDCQTPFVPAQEAVCGPAVDATKSLTVDLVNESDPLLRRVVSLPTAIWSVFYIVNQLAPDSASCPIKFTMDGIPATDEEDCLPAVKVRRDQFLRPLLTAFSQGGVVNQYSFNRYTDVERLANLHFQAISLPGSCNAHGLDPGYVKSACTQTATCDCQVIAPSADSFATTQIFYRPDLSNPSSGGQGRIVTWLMTDRDFVSVKRPLLAINFEFDLLLDGMKHKVPKDWAAEFLALSSTSGESFVRQLMSLTQGFIDSRRTGGREPRSDLNSIAAIGLPSDALFQDPSTFRVFKLNQNGALELAPLRSTPDDSFRTTPIGRRELVRWLVTDDRDTGQSHAEDVCSSELFAESVTSKRFVGGSASMGLQVDPGWMSELKGVPNLLQRFRMQTCNGCHSIHEATSNSGFGSSLGITFTTNVPGLSYGSYASFVRVEWARRKNALKCLVDSACCENESARKPRPLQVR